MQTFFLSEHSALTSIFTEDIRIPLDPTFFVIFFDLATAFGYEDREADYRGEALIVFGNFVSVGN